MSADNGIYILKTADGYRVAYAHAIDNLSYYRDKDPTNFASYVHETWGKSPLFDSLACALQHANQLESSVPMGTEYGVCVLDYSNYHLVSVDNNHNIV